MMEQDDRIHRNTVPLLGSGDSKLERRHLWLHNSDITGVSRRLLEVAGGRFAFRARVASDCEASPGVKLTLYSPMLMLGTGKSGGEEDGSA